MNNKVIKVAMVGLGIGAAGLLGSAAKDIYKVISKTKNIQKEINKVRERQKELMEEFKQCEMDSERHKELIKEIKECNNKLMEYWKQQLEK